ncbi:MAG: hypothetical protein J0H36_13485, partial [Hyphomicrobium denitrificans]|nr:hypothetical protein [Hyphomicrobium denitrificans]
ARKLQASAALAAAIFNIRTFSVVLVVAHGGPIVEVRVTGSNSAAEIDVRSITPAEPYCTWK